MIHIILEMSDEVYEKLRCGLKIGPFTFSFDDLKTYGVRIKDIKHCEDNQND